MKEKTSCCLLRHTNRLFSPGDGINIFCPLESFGEVYALIILLSQNARYLEVIKTLYIN